MLDVLVVEDDDMLSAALVEVLKIYGLAASRAACMRRAFDILQAASPRLVMLDLSLGGHELGLNELQASARAQRIPIILMSGANDLAERARLMRAPAWLEKPFAIPDMLRTLARLGVPARELRAASSTCP